jgi:hypothetical protein
VAIALEKGRLTIPRKRSPLGLSLTSDLNHSDELLMKALIEKRFQKREKEMKIATMFAKIAKSASTEDERD